MLFVINDDFTCLSLFKGVSTTRKEGTNNKVEREGYSTTHHFSKDLREKVKSNNSSYYAYLIQSAEFRIPGPQKNKIFRCTLETFDYYSRIILVLTH